MTISAYNGKIFLEFIIRKMSHELPVIGQLDQVIKDQWKCNGIDRLGNNRHFEQRQLREHDNHSPR